MGKDTIKVKRKCCHSKPPCKSCPIVVLREALKESKAEEARKQQAPKKAAAELQEGQDPQGSDQVPVTPNTVDENSTTGEAPARNSAPPTLLEQAEAIVAQRYAKLETTGETEPLSETPEGSMKKSSNKAPKKAVDKNKKKGKKAGKKRDTA